MRTRQECAQTILPVRDVLEIIGGKWKLPILTVLSAGNRRFKELERDIAGITPRMLVKELRDLEMNALVARKENNSNGSVEYSLTDYGRSLDEVVAAMRRWGLEHRKRIFSNA